MVKPKFKKGKKASVKTRKRMVFTKEQKFYAIKMKKEGLSARAIGAAFKEIRLQTPIKYHEYLL